MERTGREVRVISTLDAEGHADMRRTLGEGADRLKRDMLQEVEELYRILHSYQPESMLGALWFRNTPMGFGEQSSKDETVMAHVEYAATLYARNRGPGQQFVVPPHVLEDVQRRVEGLFASTVWLWMAQDAKKHGDAPVDAKRDLWIRTLMNSLVVRYPGHYDRMKEMLLGIESRMHRDVSHWLDWSITDGVKVGDAIISLVDERLNVAYRRGAQEAEKLWVGAWPKGRGRLARLVKRLLPPTKRPWNARKVYCLTAWTQFLMQDAPVFTVSELAERSGIEEGRVRALMEATSLAWGSCGEECFALPHPTPPFQVQPSLSLGDNRYLVVVPTSFTWALRPLAEQVLKEEADKGEPHGWEQYEGARSEFAESRVIELLRAALPRAGVFGNLKFSWMDHGVPREGELDALALADDHAILVEIKAGTMTESARRGGADSMRERLDALIGEAHEQALKARDFMESTDRVEFEVGTERLRVRSGQMHDYLLVTVNLDALDPFTTNLNQLVDFGVMRDGDLPWSVSLLDLEEIVEALELPVQLVHYLHRRRRVNELGFVEAHDEIDWFGHYLAEGLYFEHLVQAREGNGPYRWSIMGYSEGLDACFMHDERYEGDAPPIPRQQMPDEMRALLRELEDTAPHGYLHISLALLELGWDARETFFRNAVELSERTRADGANHDMTMVLDDGEGGITFMCDVDRESLQRNLFAYCQLKKHQCRCSRWVGIGRLVDSGNWVDEAIVIKAPWEYDEMMEEAVAQALPPLSA